MRRLVLMAGLALALAGCNPDPNVATPNQAVIAVNAYNAAVASGTSYLRLPLCGAVGATVLCRTQGVSQSVYSALRSGRVARRQILAALAANSAAPLTAIQALEAAYAVIQTLPTSH